jgi:hypothetical protein
MHAARGLLEDIRRPTWIWRSNGIDSYQKFLSLIAVRSIVA